MKTRTRILLCLALSPLYFLHWLLGRILPDPAKAHGCFGGVGAVLRSLFRFRGNA